MFNWRHRNVAKERLCEAVATTTCGAKCDLAEREKVSMHQRTILVVHVCATAHLPIPLVVGASFGPALSELGVQHRKRACVGAGLSPHEVRIGHDGTQPKNCDFFVDYTGEAVSSQSDYYMAASRLVPILVRTNALGFRILP